MEPMKKAITDLSDDHLVEAYRTASPDLRPEIAEEILRRGLDLPDSEEPGEATVDWGGEGYEEDPGSGALPNPF